MEALRSPWQFFCTNGIDEEMMKRIEKELENARQAALAMKHYLTNLQKTGLAVNAGVEVIARDGYTMTTVQLEDLQTLVNDERDRSRFTNRGRGTTVQNRGRGASSVRGNARSSGVGRQGYGEPHVNPLPTQIAAMPGDSTERAGRGRRGTRGTRGGRVDVRSIGGRSSHQEFVPPESTASNILVNGNPTSSAVAVEIMEVSADESSAPKEVESKTEPKRKRCDIDQCVEYCEDSIHPVCLECAPSNHSLQFCSMHLSHKSHSGQSGFIVELDEANSSAIQSRSMDSNIEGNSVTVTVTEQKVLWLFKEGFNQSSKSNISPEQKVLGALNHSCYKTSLHVIASFYKLPVELPDNDSLCKTVPRENYLKALVQAFIKRNVEV